MHIRAAQLLNDCILLHQASAQILRVPLSEPQLILKLPQAPHLLLSKAQISLGARQLSQQARILLKCVNGLLPLFSQSLVCGAQLGLQVLYLLLLFALVLFALFPGGLTKMLQRLAGMLMLFLQRQPVSLFDRNALLQV